LIIFHYILIDTSKLVAGCLKQKMTHLSMRLFK
jgi:hypothetical protein